MTAKERAEKARKISEEMEDNFGLAHDNARATAREKGLEEGTPEFWEILWRDMEARAWEEYGITL